MTDIVLIQEGLDLGVADSIVSKAGNVVSVQLNELEYAASFGVDLRFFLESEFQFQNESFKSYLVQRLTESHVNVAQVIDVLDTLFQKLTFYVGDARQNTGGLIR